MTLFSNYALLALALGQLLLPPVLFSSGFDAQAQRPPLPFEPNPAMPAGYAFAIWGAIYLGALASAIRQLLPGAPSHANMDRIRWLCIGGYACCIAWLLAARFGPLWATVPLIWCMLACLGPAFVMASKIKSGKAAAEGVAAFRTKWLIAAPLALYAGWLTAAAFVNLADVLPGYGFGRFGLSAQAFGVLMIAGAALIAFVIIAQSNMRLLYMATVIWALVAIVVRNGVPGIQQPVSLAAALAIVLLLMVGIRTQAALRA
ncbi:MAG: hypothetical protein ACRC56_05685 [Bosea sp. (in: a-proteobacteria)]